MGQEFELKYAATERQQAAISDDFPDFSEITMETTYYDTPDGALSARRITLRRRMENGVSVCTVKTPGSGGARGEWELECGDIREAISVLCKLGGPQELLSLTASGVVEVCGARFIRRVVARKEEGCTVELALDRGVLLGGGRELPLCEVEVELKSGSAAAAAAYAAALAKKYGLTPEPRSKFRRALALTKGA